MKKKGLIFLPIISLLFATGCGNDQGGQKPPIENTPVEPNFQLFESVTELFNYLEVEGVNLEATFASAYSRVFESYEQGMFQVTEKNIDETGTAYQNKVLTIDGIISTAKFGDEFLPDTQDQFTFKQIAILDEKTDTFYKVLDHEDGKENDGYFKENRTPEHEGEYEIETGTNTIRTTLRYYDSFLKPYVVEGFDTIQPEIDNTDGSVIYRIEDTQKVSTDSYVIQSTLAFDFVFNKDGILTSHAFEFEENDITDPSEPVKYSSVFDRFDLTLSEKTEYDGSFLNPLDYFLTDYQINLVAKNTYDPDMVEVDPKAFPYDYIVEAQAKNVVPEKALDTNLEIVASSNEEVIKKTTYSDGTSIFKAIGEGDTVLTIRSESGIEKRIDVTVDAPNMEKIEIKVYSSVNYVNEKTGLYIITTPENTIDEYVVNNLTPDIITVIQDDRGYYDALNLKEGIAKVEVYSKKNPKIRDEVSYKITTKLSQEEALQRFIGTYTGDLPHESGNYYIEDAVTINILNDHEAEFIFNTNQLGHYFIKDHAYKVTYELNTTNKYTHFLEFFFSPIETESPTGIKFIYDNIVARFYMNGINYSFQIATNNTEIYIDPLIFEGEKTN